MGRRQAVIAGFDLRVLVEHRVDDVDECLAAAEKP
jgi:hypothetical protein